MLNYLRSKNGVSGNEVRAVEEILNPITLKSRTIESFGDDEPFVYATDFNISDPSQIRLGTGTTEDPVYFALTTKRLLSVLNTVAQNGDSCRLPLILHMDATFKTNDNEYPFMIMGISDNNSRFHPISMVLISHRTEAQYIRVLNDLKHISAQVIPGYQLDPNFIMIDAEEAERNASIAVFGIDPSRVLMCFFHVQYNCKNKLSGQSKEIKDSVREDLR